MIKSVHSSTIHTLIYTVDSIHSSSQKYAAKKKMDKVLIKYCTKQICTFPAKKTSLNGAAVKRPYQGRAIAVGSLCALL